MGAVLHIDDKGVKEEYCVEGFQRYGSPLIQKVLDRVCRAADELRGKSVP